MAGLALVGRARKTGGTAEYADQLNIEALFVPILFIVKDFERGRRRVLFALGCFSARRSSLRSGKE